MGPCLTELLADKGSCSKSFGAVVAMEVEGSRTGMQAWHTFQRPSTGRALHLNLIVSCCSRHITRTVNPSTQDQGDRR